MIRPSHTITRKQAKIFCGLSFAFCAVSSGVIYLRKKLEDRIFDLNICQSSIKAMEQHKISLDVLGPPVKFTRPMLSNTFNKITSTDATIAIPVAGSKTAGTLLIVACKNEKDTDWNLISLKLEVPKQNIVVQ